MEAVKAKEKAAAKAAPAVLVTSTDEKKVTIGDMIAEKERAKAEKEAEETEETEETATVEEHELPPTA
jgi:hypothetical protein